MMLFALLMAMTPVEYHPGGLNAEGCHNDRKRGTYHCHRGPAKKSTLRTVKRKASRTADGVRSRAARLVGDAYYPNCAAARAAGAAPIRRGQDGYRAGLDRDNDGTACE